MRTEKVMFSRNSRIAILAALLAGTTVTSAFAQSEVPREKAFTSGRTVGRDAMPRGGTPGVVGGGTSESGSAGASGAGGAGANGAGGAGAAGAGGANGGGSAGGGSPGR